MSSFESSFETAVMASQESARRAGAALVALGEASFDASSDAHAALRRTTEGLANRYGGIREQLSGPVQFVAGTASEELDGTTRAEIDELDETTRELFGLVELLDARVAQLEELVA
jgi:hypothetical protein